MMYSDDDAMLEFAKQWYPYGGGEDSDIFVEFGLPASAYFRRLAKLVEGSRGRRLSPQQIQGIRTVVRSRLARRQTAA
ncbi:DUF3263 domain-containing protein [Rhodococcus sp. IEGM 1307]|uniref:DUF3263 domain-containing protein n=1 Tax=Rhodococcus sp. IEGM 1307 TaxID=3047091 RepID=UPI0024B84D83|nr:DUF3263 domain-containing protein [Rhodococcus sp. IEGM 1307]MDI9980175.1 DUF3263 domain-containing protein [Rhodococcus sp. IEGM 1307]